MRHPVAADSPAEAISAPSRPARPRPSRAGFRRKIERAALGDDSCSRLVVAEPLGRELQLPVEVVGVRFGGSGLAVHLLQPFVRLRLMKVSRWTARKSSTSVLFARAMGAGDRDPHADESYLPGVEIGMHRGRILVAEFLLWPPPVWIAKAKRRRLMMRQTGATLARRCRCRRTP